MSSLKAIIIGGGIGGLAAAIALRRAGHSVEVYERSLELREVGAGISLWANAIRGLDSLGLGDAVRSFSVQDVPAAVRSRSGRVLIDAPAFARTPQNRELMVMLRRSDLQGALLDAFFPQEVQLDKQCVGFEQDAGGVTAKFENGSTVRGDLLIGADGLHSAVRAELFGREKPAYSGYTAWRAVVKFTATEQLLPGETLGRGARFGQMPLSNRRVYWYATKNAPEGERSMHGEMAVLRQTFHGWHAPIEALINAADESLILRNDIYDRPVLSEWGEGRVTLLGDAAHPMTPNLGQGACQAIEDAVALGKALQENKDVAAALRAYEARCIPRANEMVKRSRQFGRIGQWQNPLAVWTRNFLMKSFGAKMQAKEMDRILRDEG